MKSNIGINKNNPIQSNRLKMSFDILVKDIDARTKKKLDKLCRVAPKKTIYDDDPKPITCYSVEEDQDGNDIVKIPLGCWKYFCDEFPNEGPYPKTKLKCSKKLLCLDPDCGPDFVYDIDKKSRDQDKVFKEGMKILLKNHVLFLALFTGFGKSSLANYMACKLKVKVAVICFYEMVRKQLIAEFENFGGAKVQDLSKSKKVDMTADVFVIGTIKSSLMKSTDFSFIGLVIFDEAHISTATALSKSLLRFTPKYLIGLSATPDRSDGLDKMLNMYFGKPDEFIVRKEIKDFIVYKVVTPFKPDIEYIRFKGTTTISWSTVESSLSNNKERIKMIYKIIKREPDRRPMVLNKLQDCNKNLSAYLTKKNIDNELLIDKMKTWRKEARVLVAGLKKAGVGFDDPTRNMLITMTSVKDVRQNEGRIRCANNVIYDIVDDHSSLENHWSGTKKYMGREKWYISRGATIKTLLYQDGKFIEVPNNSKIGSSSSSGLSNDIPTERLSKPMKE